MGNRISGTPSCAFTPPSASCTALCTILSGCTKTSMHSGSMPKSHLASIISKPLFIIVALSIVILAPISQLGCFKARAAVTPANSSIGVVRKGPPEAVRRILSMALPSSPTKHWKIALCSLSTGRIGARCFTASSVMSSPATTSVSLLASAMVLPASMAATVGRSPAKPTMAVTTTSTSGSRATSQMASAPVHTLMGRSASASRTVS